MSFTYHHLYLFLNTFNIKLSSYSSPSLLGNNGEICTIITSFFGNLTVLFSLHGKWIECLSQKLCSSVEIRQHINFPKNTYWSNCPKCSKLRHIVGLKDNFQSHINVFLYYFRVMIHWNNFLVYLWYDSIFWLFILRDTGIHFSTHSGRSLKGHYSKCSKSEPSSGSSWCPDLHSSCLSSWACWRSQETIASL